MRFPTEAEAITYIFRSMRKLPGKLRGPDEQTRDITPTKTLLRLTQLPRQTREYAVVTGSKGKGSTTAITAKLLQHLGHKVGLIASPHLVSWRERIRVDGHAIPEADLCRILNDLAPMIDAIEDTLQANRYFSPQGIFLAIALQWFDEQGVTAAVLEVGRGGRFDDISVVNNKLSLFTPIMLEHPDYLGPTVERIAWHKAGIIKPSSYAYSVPQSPDVMRVLQTEAESHQAQFDWIAPKDMGIYRGAAPHGQHIQLGRYGEVTLSLLGRYQIENASLAVIAAGNIHARLGGIPHASPDYVARIQAGLADVQWPGRCQQLESHPTVFVDGAINAESAQLFVESIREGLQPPVVSIVGVPEDKDYHGVLSTLSSISQHLIITETTRNPTLHFLPADEALALARTYLPHASHTPTLDAAVDDARRLAGTQGTILIIGTQSIVADAMRLWNASFEHI
jgi:dihydrofolate synthase / folylpolyglutamate synthase